MKKLLIILLATMLLSSCASLTYQTADGTKVTYSRFLTTADTIKGNVGTASIEANGQKIDNETLKSILGAIVK